MIWPGGPEKGNSFGGYSDQQKGGSDVFWGNKVKIGKKEGKSSQNFLIREGFFLRDLIDYVPLQLLDYAQ